MERVGFIGLGDMGAPLARHLGKWLHTTGGSLTVFDLNSEAVAALVARAYPVPAGFVAPVVVLVWQPFFRPVLDGVA